MCFEEHLRTAASISFYFETINVKQSSFCTTYYFKILFQNKNMKLSKIVNPPKKILAIFIYMYIYIYIYIYNKNIKIKKLFADNQFHNILRLLDVLLNFPFTLSETMADYH